MIFFAWLALLFKALASKAVKDSATPVEGGKPGGTNGIVPAFVGNARNSFIGGIAGGGGVSEGIQAAGTSLKTDFQSIGSNLEVAKDAFGFGESSAAATQDTGGLFGGFGKVPRSEADFLGRMSSFPSMENGGVGETIPSTKEAPDVTADKRALITGESQAAGNEAFFGPTDPPVDVGAGAASEAASGAAGEAAGEAASEAAAGAATEAATEAATSAVVEEAASSGFFSSFFGGG